MPMNIISEFDSFTQKAISRWEKSNPVNVRYAVGIDFLPDGSADPQSGVQLVPAVGVYLEIPGPSSDTVVTNSFYYTPYLVDEAEFDDVIDKALTSMLVQREAAINEAKSSLRERLGRE